MTRHVGGASTLLDVSMLERDAISTAGGVSWLLASKAAIHGYTMQFWRVYADLVEFHTTLGPVWMSMQAALQFKPEAV